MPAIDGKRVAFLATDGVEQVELDKPWQAVTDAGGRPELVEPLSLAAIAAGADALLIDVHVQPEQALCDAKQALRPEQFAGLMTRLAGAAAGLGRSLQKR